MAADRTAIPLTCAAIVTPLLLLALLAQAAPQAAPQAWRVRAGTLAELQVDGVLDEASWHTA